MAGARAGLDDGPIVIDPKRLTPMPFVRGTLWPFVRGTLYICVTECGVGVAAIRHMCSTDIYVFHGQRVAKRVWITDCL